MVTVTLGSKSKARTYVMSPATAQRLARAIKGEAAMVLAGSADVSALSLAAVDTLRTAASSTGPGALFARNLLARLSD